MLVTADTVNALKEENYYGDNYMIKRLAHFLGHQMLLM
jgi:hypothetical protein